MSSLLINAPPPVYRPSCLCRATLWTIARPTTRQPASLLVSARTTARVVALEELVKHVQPCTIGESRHRRRESASADDARAREQAQTTRKHRRRESRWVSLVKSLLDASGDCYNPIMRDPPYTTLCFYRFVEALASGSNCRMVTANPFMLPSMFFCGYRSAAAIGYSRAEAARCQW